MTHRIVVINPGSTSTKLALFEDERPVSAEVFRHGAPGLGAELWEQFEARWSVIERWARSTVREASAIAACGGLFRPLAGGTYEVNERMLSDARAGVRGQHASNLGCALASRLAALYRCKAYVVDPVSVDEFEPLARYSGHPLTERRSLSHALNIHAAARRAATELRRPLEGSTIIVAHLGGGISIAPVKSGRIIDVNDASSDGPFSPERTGGLPLQPFTKLCFSGSYTEAGIRELVMGKGGLVAYLGTNSALEVERRIAAGDEDARGVYEAMAYQISKEIGAMSTVVRGHVDAIALAGGLAASSLLVNWIRGRVEFIAPVLVFAGEDEMAALAEGVLRVLRGESPALEY